MSCSLAMRLDASHHLAVGQNDQDGRRGETVTSGGDMPWRLLTDNRDEGLLGTEFDFKLVFHRSLFPSVFLVARLSRAAETHLAGAVPTETGCKKVL